MFRFANPEYFFLIILIPILLWYYNKLQKKIRFTYPLAHKVVIEQNYYFILKNTLNFFLLLSIIFALANPQKLKTFTDRETKGINIIFALDTSGSMTALDFNYENKELNRLDALKIVVRDFIQKRTTDKMGIVVFGEEAFTQCPLTIDQSTLDFLVDRIELGMAGDSTAIGSAILLSTKRLLNSDSKSKVIILVTDGRNNTGKVNPITAAKLAKQKGVKIYTIGIGSKGKPVPIIQQTIFGTKRVFVNIDLDDYTLKQIAQISDGKYFNAQDFKSLENILNDIDRLEKTTFKVKNYYETTYYYKYFLIMAILLLGVKVVYFNGVRQVFP